MEAGKARGGKKLQEILSSFSSSSSPRIVVEAGIKEKIKSKFYQQAVTNPACNQKHNWTISVVQCPMYEIHLSGK
jgi:hypothetical protein